MSGPHEQDPNQQWSPSQPEQQPPGSEEHTEQAAFHEPAYAPTQYGAPQSYPGAPQYPQPGQESGQPSGQQPTQYGPTEQVAHQPTQFGQPGQYQPPQYGQQYPPTDAYGQPSPYGPPGAQYGEAPPAFGQPEAKKGSRKSLAILLSIAGVLAVIVVAVVLVLGFWKPGFFVTTKLDVNKAQQGVQQILTDQTNGYGVKKADDVKCNNGQNPTVRKGDTFTCDVSIDGQHKQVTVTFQDNNGTYEVGRPK